MNILLRRALIYKPFKLHQFHSYGFSEAQKLSLYKILNVSSTSSQDDIKKGYLELAKKYHPDTAPDDLTLTVDIIFCVSYSVFRINLRR